MASERDIETSVNEMLGFIAEKSPNLGPAIFVQLAPTSVADLCSTAQQRALLMNKWSQRNATGVVFMTTVDYKQKMIYLKEIRATTSELDAKLGSLESIMKMCVEGGDEEVKVTTAHFLEANGYGGEKKTEKYILQQVYNAAYAVKVLLSNAPMRMAINQKKKKQLYTLPLAADVNVLEVIESITLSNEESGSGETARSGKRKVKTNNSDESNEDSDDDNNEIDNDDSVVAEKSGAGKKRRKKKRGGKRSKDDVPL